MKLQIYGKIIGEVGRFLGRDPGSEARSESPGRPGLAAPESPNRAPADSDQEPTVTGQQPGGSAARPAGPAPGRLAEKLESAI